jgi:putative transposase
VRRENFLVVYARTARFSGHRDWIDLGFVERERTPESAMALVIQSHVAGLSLSNTVDLLAALGVQPNRKAVPDYSNSQKFLLISFGST